uniref:Uncharacterized protein n=1 Tax=Oryza sativa subsp. japonica TaxID=39947 RepID=Q69QR1_ORYSJ|nr:hypothetical protein [Oryza sativa Japonica Group]
MAAPSLDMDMDMAAHVLGEEEASHEQIVMEHREFREAEGGISEYAFLDGQCKKRFVMLLD